MRYCTNSRSRTKLLLRSATILAGGLFAVGGSAAFAQTGAEGQPEPAGETASLD